MSIPKRDSTFTTKDLDKAAEKWLAAGHEYWIAMNKAGMGGAVVWVNDTDGFGCVYTRGEYCQQIVQNIERLGPTHYFGCMKDE